VKEYENGNENKEAEDDFVSSFLNAAKLLADEIITNETFDTHRTSKRN
jgi:hypothetical protein